MRVGLLCMCIFGMLFISIVVHEGVHWFQFKRGREACISTESPYVFTKTTGDIIEFQTSEGMIKDEIIAYCFTFAFLLLASWYLIKNGEVFENG